MILVFYFYHKESLGRDCGAEIIIKFVTDGFHCLVLNFKYQEPFVHRYNYLCTYDLYSPVRNFFDAGRYITWASGRGLGPGNGVFGPCEMASSR